MDTKEFIKILDSIYKMLDEKKYEEAKEYILSSKLNCMANSNTIETYVDNILSELE